jgi:hypothetical protein
MKATNKIAPALLSDPDAVKVYQVIVDLGNSRWVELNYSEKTWATEEYNRIKGIGIYCGAWIKTISLQEKIL